MKQRIISNGGPGRHGFVNFQEKFLYEKIWIGANDLASHSTYPATGPSTRALPNTVQTRVWSFSSTDQNMVYSWFSLPSRYWSYKLDAPTGINLRFYWYTDTTAAGTICWASELAFVRTEETANFVTPVWSQIYRANPSQYIMYATEYLDFPLYNPSGATTIKEGLFWVKMIRDGSNASDTYNSVAYLLGVSVEIPLIYP
jgi:hypothetical protein